MKEHKAVDTNGREFTVPPFIVPKFASTPNCPIPHCQSCEFSRQVRRNPNVKTSKAIPEKEGALSRDCYEASDFVSVDQFVIQTPGLLFTGFGHESDINRFHGGTIITDAAIGIIWVKNQVSLGTGETVMVKIRFEE